MAAFPNDDTCIETVRELREESRPFDVHARRLIAVPGSPTGVLTPLLLMLTLTPGSSLMRRRKRKPALTSYGNLTERCVTKIRRSRHFSRNLLMCRTNWWRARQDESGHWR